MYIMYIGLVFHETFLPMIQQVDMDGALFCITTDIQHMCTITFSTTNCFWYKNNLWSCKILYLVSLKIQYSAASLDSF